MLNLDDYEEISEEEFGKLGTNEGIYIRNYYNGKTFYFKKKSKDVFEDESYKITIYNSGEITILGKQSNHNFIFSASLPLLEQAIEEAKRRRNGKS